MHLISPQQPTLRRHYDVSDANVFVVITTCMFLIGQSSVIKNQVVFEAFQFFLWMDFGVLVYEFYSKHFSKVFCISYYISTPLNPFFINLYIFNR